MKNKFILKTVRINMKMTVTVHGPPRDTRAKQIALDQNIAWTGRKNSFFGLSPS